MASISFIIITTIFILILTSCSSSCSASTPSTKTTSHPFKKIYAFGDSSTDTGNTRSVSGPNGFGHAGQPPYGMTFFHRPTNRYSDGRLVIDFIAESLSLPYLPPYRNIASNASSASHGVNFAVAGATAINHDFFVKNNLTLDMSTSSILTQLNSFNQFLETQGNKAEKFEDALFWVGEIGANDYAYIFGSSISGDTIQKLGISSVTMFLQALLKKAAKYMVVQSQPLSGCFTLAMTLSPVDDRDSLGCVKSVNDQSKAHNSVLQEKLQDLRNKFPNATIIYADYWNGYYNVMKNPSRFGFKQRFKACCGSGGPYHFGVSAGCGTPSASVCSKPSQYINWDGVHLTETMQKVLADMFLSGKATHPPFSHLLEMKLRHG